MAKKSAPQNPGKRPQQSTPPPRATANSAPKAASAASQQPWAFYLVALLVTAACYWSSLGNALVNWDDDPNIIENPNLQLVGQGQPWGETFSNIFDLEKGNVIGNYNPLPILTFAFEKAWVGGEFGDKYIRQIHLDNLLLHLVVVFLAMQVLLLLGVGRWGALIGGLLMGIHPMRVESVAWATERKDVLFAAFFFASLLAYIRYVKAQESAKQGVLWVLWFGLGVLSLYSKVQAVTLVVSMGLVDYYLRRPFSWRLVVEKLPLFAASVAIGLANLHTLKVQGSTDDSITGFGFVDRLVVGSWSFCVYLYKLLIPNPMSPLYPYPKPLDGYMYVGPILFFAAIGLALWLLRRDARLWVFGLGFFFVNVVLLLQFFGAGQGYLADRFTYVPYFGFFFLAAWGFEQIQQKEKYRTALYGGTAVLLLAFCYLTVRQVGIWKNGDTLWTHVMQYQYDAKNQRYVNSLPFWNRGQYRRRQAEAKNGDQRLYDLALSDYSAGIDCDRNNPELYNSRGKTYFDLGMRMPSGDPRGGEYLRKALADYDSAIRLSANKPKTNSEALINRGAAKGAAGLREEALADLTKGLEQSPDNKNGYLNRSIVLFQLGRYADAVNDYTKVLEFDPNDANIWYERGLCRRILRQPKESVADLSKAIQLNPKLGLAYLERGRAKVLGGDLAGAKTDYQQAQRLGIQLTPADVTEMNR